MAATPATRPSAVRSGRPSRPTASHEVGRARGRRDLTGYLFLAPTLLAVGAFTLYPLVDTAWLSLTDSNGVRGHFVGWSNYDFVLHDPDFFSALWNTVYMGALTLLIGVPLSLVVATLINSAGRASGLYKALYFSPNVTSAIAAAITFTYLLYPSADGWGNTVLGWVGLDPVQWFADPATARFGVVLLSVWHGVGYLTLIWLAGLQAIPRDLHEAAATDGANAVKRWWHITVPGLRPVLFFIVVVQSISLFKRFADVYQIGGADGQPGGVLTTLMTYIYRIGFNTFDFGKASAAAMALFVIVLVVTLVNTALFRRGES